VSNSDERFPEPQFALKRKRVAQRAFTLLELLIVITIIGILAGILIPNLANLIGGAEKTKTQAAFSGYLSALTAYKSEYKYYPPLFTSEEPVDLAVSDNGQKFIMALKGKKLVNDNWQSLTGNEVNYNRKGRLFHTFDEEEFDDQGFLVDTWGNRHIKIIVDHDRDGFITIPSDEEVDELNGKRIKKAMVIYVLAKDDDKGEGDNVFSWTSDD
jgi:prepilin-type N-terminal cleavage/methylation domain-containing protein